MRKLEPSFKPSFDVRVFDDIRETIPMLLSELDEWIVRMWKTRASAVSDARRTGDISALFAPRRFSGSKYSKATFLREMRFSEKMFDAAGVARPENWDYNLKMVRDRAPLAHHTAGMLLDVMRGRRLGGCVEAAGTITWTR